MKLRHPVYLPEDNCRNLLRINDRFFAKHKIEYPTVCVQVASRFYRRECYPVAQLVFNSEMTFYKTGYKTSSDGADLTIN